MIERNSERGGSWGILCTYAGALGMADEEIMKTRNSESNGNVRGTRLSVFGMGLMSRLSGLSSSSCLVILGLEADTGSMGGGGSGCGERWVEEHRRTPIAISGHLNTDKQAAISDPATTKCSISKCSCPPPRGCSGALLAARPSCPPLTIVSSAWFAFFAALLRHLQGPVPPPPCPSLSSTSWPCTGRVIGAFVAFEYLAEWTISWCAPSCFC